MTGITPRRRQLNQRGLGPAYRYGIAGLCLGWWLSPSTASAEPPREPTEEPAGEGPAAEEAPTPKLTESKEGAPSENAPSEDAPSEDAPPEGARRVEVRVEVKDGVEYELRREWYEEDTESGAVADSFDRLPEDVRRMLPPDLQDLESADGQHVVIIRREEEVEEEEDEDEAKITANLKDGLKISVPAGAHDLWFHPGVGYWIIAQNVQGMTFGAAAIDTRTRVRQQIRANFDMGWGPLRTFMQVQDARAWGFEDSTVSNDANLDLHQGFVQARGENASGSLGGSVTLGRQEIWVGTRRLFAERPWNTNGQAFDALRLRGHAGKFRADMWAAMLAKPDSFSVDDGVTVQQYQTRGGYVGMSVLGWDPLPAVSVEAMTAWIAEDKSEEDLRGQRRIASPGLRVFGTPIKGLHYDVEAYMQWGQQPAANRDHFAWAAAGTVSYTLDKAVKPRFLLGYTIASGEACTGDPALGEPCNSDAEGTRDFFDFYRRRHGYQGINDMALWRNIRDLEAGVQLQVERRVRLNLDYHFFQLQETTGRWWKLPDNLVGAGWDPTNDDHNLGHEVDLVVRYRPWQPLELQGGYGLFVPVAAGTRIAGGDDPQHFLYVRVGMNF